MSEVDDVLERSRRMLKASYAGLNMYKDSDGSKRILGLYNAVTFGRSVTFVLQNLRGDHNKFDDWYDERIQVLKEDPICSHMVDLRNKILKEGDVNAKNYDKIDNFKSSQLRAVTPPWADGSFIGDQYGGSGFYIEQPDGSEEKFYFDFEFDNVETGLYFEETQQSDKVFTAQITEVEDDLEYYVKILAELVRDANKEFSGD